MAGNRLTIRLTDEQQNQIKTATGKGTSELHLDVDALSQISDQDLDNVAGGAMDTYMVFKPY